jgi:hypothetical protein
MTRKEQSTWIMRKAWQLAKAGADRFGGKAREYLGQSIRQAWAMFRSMQKSNHPLAQSLNVATVLLSAVVGLKLPATAKAEALNTVRTVGSAVVSKVAVAFKALKNIFINRTAPATLAVATASTGNGHPLRE